MDNRAKEINHTQAKADLESFNSIWGRVIAEKNRINALIPTPLLEKDWLQLKFSVKHMMENFPAEILAPDLEMCQKYCSSASDDYLAANILYGNGQNALTVYHLQQAAEKSMKAFSLAVGIATLESLKSTHRTPQPLLSILGKYFLRDMTKFLGGLAGKDYRKTLRMVNKMVNSDPLSIGKFPFASNRARLGLETLIKTFDDLSQYTPMLEEREEEVKRVLAECIPNYKSLIMGFSGTRHGNAATQCYLLGIITFAHESPTRYLGGSLEPESYRTELGIVQAIPSLIDRTPLMIDSVNELLRHIRVGGTSEL